MTKQYRVVWESKITSKRGFGQPLALKIAEANCANANDIFFPDIVHYVKEAENRA